MPSPFCTDNIWQPCNVVNFTVPANCCVCEISQSDTHRLRLRSKILFQIYASYPTHPAYTEIPYNMATWFVFSSMTSLQPVPSSIRNPYRPVRADFNAVRVSQQVSQYDAKWTVTVQYTVICDSVETIRSWKNVHQRQNLLCTYSQTRFEKKPMSDKPH